MLQLFKNKNYSLLFTGTLVSQLGTTIYNFAIGWYLYKMDVDPFIVSLYIATGLMIDLLLSPFIGVLVDRMNKVAILVITDIIRGSAILIAGFVFFSGISLDQSIVLLFIATIILAINGSFFGISSFSLLPNVVEKNELQQANSLFSIVQSAQRIFGVLLGAAFYELVGIEMVFIINGVSYLLSAVSEMFIRIHVQKPVLIKSKEKVKQFFTEFKEGIGFVMHEEGMFVFLITIVMLNFSVAPLFTNGLPYLLSNVLDVNSYQLSYINVASAVGMIIGSIIIGTISKKVKLRETVFRGMIFQTGMFAFLGMMMVLISNDVIPYNIFILGFMFFTFLFGVANMAVNIPLNSSIVMLIDEDKRGRVIGVVSFMANGATPLALLIGGLMLRSGRMEPIVLFTVILTTITVVFMIRNAKINKLLDSLS